MAGWTLISAATLVATPWRNGLGTSRDITGHAGPNGGLGWLVSVAELERDAAFSHYPHGDRVFTPIAGDPPPQLAFDGGAFEPCPLLVPKRFPGDVPTLSHIPAPGRAFNVFVDRRYFAADVVVQRLEAGDRVVAPAASHALLYCLSGRIAAAGELLGPGDSLLGAGPAVPGAAAEDSIALVAAISALR